MGHKGHQYYRFRNGPQFVALSTPSILSPSLVVALEIQIDPLTGRGTVKFIAKSRKVDRGELGLKSIEIKFKKKNL